MIGDKPMPDVDDGIRSFQVVYHIQTEEKLFECGFANITYVNLRIANRESENYKFTESLWHYHNMFDDDNESIILFIDKFQIDPQNRNIGFGTAFLNLLINIFDNFSDVDTIALNPYPYELKGDQFYLKKPEAGDKMEDFYTHKYLSAKNRLEKFYERMGFAPYKTPEADQYDFMFLQSNPHMPKRTDPIRQLQSSRKMGELMFAYIFSADKEDDQVECSYCNQIECRKMFPNLFQ